MKLSEKMTPIQMLQTVSGICKTNGKLDWNSIGSIPEDEFKYIANMIDTYLEEQDKGSEGANQDG
tara:strand:+ start:1290 stop:1484 length:195 start_codon:yes stop_codon:yes gene_type:complete